MDVLVQHLVTVALGGGFTADDMLAEIRTTHAYRDITDDEWRWVLAFVVHGGATLGAYPEYHRVVPDDAGVHGVPDAQIAKRHRMGIGTIVSDASMEVKWFSGGRIGHVEESFIAMMKPGDCFLFAGRRLELVRVHEMSALVRKASSDKGRCRDGRAARCRSPPRWPTRWWRSWRGCRRVTLTTPSCRPPGRCWSCRPGGLPCPRPARCWPR
jgi:ATP-dependent helicase Lhr and Lhr-like helicase